MHKLVKQTIVRTERGLTIAGTRITIYQLMDYLKADQPTSQIKDLFRLSEDEINDVLEYIAQNPEQVEGEYQEVLRQAELSRDYWEERNRERFQAISTQPPTPGKKALYEKLKKRKSELGMPRSLFSLITTRTAKHRWSELSLSETSHLHTRS